MPTSPSRRRTRLAWGALLLILLLSALAALWPRAREFEVVEVGVGTLRIERSDRGTTRMRELYPLAAPAAGVLERITLEPGDAVESGQVLARLRPLQSMPLDARSAATARAELAAAEAGLSQAEARAVSARDARQRLEASGQRGLVSERELAATRALDREAAAAVGAARAVVEQARSRLALTLPDAEGRIELRAPAAGVLLKRHLQGEQPVAAGQLLLDVGEPNSLEVVGDFLSQDAVLFAPSAPARIEGWGGVPLSAHVERVEPLGELKVSALGVEEQRVRVILRLDAVPPSLGHGYQVEAFVQVREARDVHVLPIEALRREHAGWRVWRVENGRLQARAIEVGDSDGHQREIVSGLQRGDRVLRFPPPGDLEGQRVRSMP